ncbi:carboxypeptidase Q-like isoform X1 [Schistocerca piceifrons]|uniref:carboxypeptidase Q-like isoform X1 n=1 Tax=Schistocerca piceifrons TaxID=274613 RepID=UPI001F5F2E2E|nr:carboxypeptidase Q-like isoform X1 [Schistocerca piceifrons]
MGAVHIIMSPPRNRFSPKHVLVVDVTRKMMMYILFSFIIAFSCAVDCSVLDNEVHDTNDVKCAVPETLRQEIKNYEPVVNKIIDSIVYGRFRGRTWRTLAYFVDKFGSRIAGSENLENAIDFMLNQSSQFGLENVHGEEAVVPHWVRGNESAVLVSPRTQKLPMLGLGSSVGTPPEGIKAEVLVVTSFDELQEKAALVPGKIVVFNEPFKSYGETVQYRTQGASKAARLGAVATLIRSVTPFSLATPHTGQQDYADNVTHIPTACITVEDAEMLHRMAKRGDKLVIHLKMEAHTLKPATSRNTIAEIVGSSEPEKVVVVSGHLDSWDVGQGAMDDGGGAFISWNTLVILKKLGLRPRRTIRCILWTAEEEGLIGAQAYVKAHKNETRNLDYVMESDEGTFLPMGLSFSGSEKAGCILQEVLKLFKPIGASRYSTPQVGGSDIALWTDVGVPSSSLINANEHYFWFHHTAADMVTVEDPHVLDLCTAIWTAAAYVVADLSADIPRD